MVALSSVAGAACAFKETGPAAIPASSSREAKIHRSFFMRSLVLEILDGFRSGPGIRERLSPRGSIVKYVSVKKGKMSQPRGDTSDSPASFPAYPGREYS